MNLQFVDWGTLLALLGLLGSVVGVAVGLLWRLIANQTKEMNRRFDEQKSDMNRRFDHQDRQLAELRSDVGELSTDMAVVKNDLSYLKPRSERMDANIVEIMRDLGRLEGKQRSSAPKAKVGAGGS